MPRYFFHVHDGQCSTDHTGMELPDIEAARRAAVQLAGVLLNDEEGRFWDGGAWRVDVAGEDGRTLFRLQFTVADAPGSEPG